MRVRARLGLRFSPDDHWRFEMRLRTGQQQSQQSPHITILDFNGNDTGDTSFDLDRWLLRGQAGSFWAMAGRDVLPTWKQDEDLFDDDVTFAGVSIGSDHQIGPGRLSWCGGLYSAPVGMRSFSGSLGVAQALYQPVLGELHWTFALSGFHSDADADDPEAPLLLQGNGFRDYSVLELSLQARWQAAGRDLTLGGDLMHNFEGYRPDDPDPITAAGSDETEGYVLLATYGGLDRAGDWLAGYSYCHIELLSVHSSYSQDDWVRWGNATQTRASDMKGHELRFARAFSAHMNLAFRLFLAEAITSIEDGKRFRADFNYRF